MPGDTYGGVFAFSEAESTAVKDALKSYNPTMFLTIHSGTQALFTPYAFTDREPIAHEQNMLQILSEMNDQFCGDCAAGAAGEKIGYYSSGTCLDYAYDQLQIPYTFAFEIYAKQLDIPTFRKASSFLQFASGKEVRNELII